MVGKVGEILPKWDTLAESPGMRTTEKDRVRENGLVIWKISIMANCILFVQQERNKVFLACNKSATKLHLIMQQKQVGLFSQKCPIGDTFSRKSVPQLSPYIPITSLSFLGKWDGWDTINRGKYWRDMSVCTYRGDCIRVVEKMGENA